MVDNQGFAPHQPPEKDASAMTELAALGNRDVWLTLAIGAFLRRMSAIELRSALLGAASVLLALPLSEAAISQQWNVATTIISGLGLVALIAGLLVSVGLVQQEPEPPHG